MTLTEDASLHMIKCESDFDTNIQKTEWFDYIEYFPGIPNVICSAKKYATTIQ